MTIESMPETQTLIAAFAGKDGSRLTNEHFGSAERYLIYRCSREGCVSIADIANTSPEERQHGDPQKASSVRDMLSKHHVVLAVARHFGPNIKRIKKTFLPIITDAEYVAEAVNLLTARWEEVLAAWRTDPDQRTALQLKKNV